MSRIDRREGRRLFGSDPAAYDAARPGHADRVYTVLRERCGLREGTSVLEVGPGTGQATRRLLELGAHPLVALEPDPALASYLEASLGGQVELEVVALEDAHMPAQTFDLAVAASSFHWVEEAAGLGAIFDALRPGGWVATWWTLFGEAGSPDAFMRAIDPLLADLRASPTSGQPGRPAHALDAEARLQALADSGFRDGVHELMRWDASWDTAGVRALYSTFSPIATLDEERRDELLDAVARVAEERFGGRVQRRLATSLYTAQRPA